MLEEGKIHQSIANGHTWITDHDGKESLIENHFSAIMGKGPPRHRDFNWTGMVFPACDLGIIGDSFTEKMISSLD
jgi:hypothetical protein